jgi:hypothetical protein
MINIFIIDLHSCYLWIFVERSSFTATEKLLFVFVCPREKEHFWRVMQNVLCSELFHSLAPDSVWWFLSMVTRYGRKVKGKGESGKWGEEETSQVWINNCVQVKEVDIQFAWLQTNR